MWQVRIDACDATTLVIGCLRNNVSRPHLGGGQFLPPPGLLPLLPAHFPSQALRKEAKFILVQPISPTPPHSKTRSRSDFSKPVMTTCGRPDRAQADARPYTAMRSPHRSFLVGSQTDIQQFSMGTSSGDLRVSASQTAEHEQAIRDRASSCSEEIRDSCLRHPYLRVSPQFFPSLERWWLPRSCTSATFILT